VTPVRKPREDTDRTMTLDALATPTSAWAQNTLSGSILAHKTPMNQTAANSSRNFTLNFYHITSVTADALNDILVTQKTFLLIKQ